MFILNKGLSLEVELGLYQSLNNERRRIWWADWICEKYLSVIGTQMDKEDIRIKAASPQNQNVNFIY